MKQRKFKLLQTVFFEASKDNWIETYIVSTLPKIQSDFYLIAEYGPRVHESKLRSEADHNFYKKQEAGV